MLAPRNPNEKFSIILKVADHIDVFCGDELEQLKTSLKILLSLWSNFSFSQT